MGALEWGSGSQRVGGGGELPGVSTGSSRCLV